MQRQLETAKVEVTKPFVQEAELAEKLERLSALNALLNMDEKGDDALGMDMLRRKKTEGRKLLDMMSRSQHRKKRLPKDQKQAKEPPMHRYRTR